VSALLRIIQHSLGVDEFGQGEQYRDHFVTGEGSDDHPACMEAVERGLMKCFPNQQHMGGMDFFRVTDAGREWMAANSPPPPKLTRSQKRYRSWHDSGASDCGWSFIDWCKEYDQRNRGAVA